MRDKEQLTKKGGQCEALEHGWDKGSSTGKGPEEKSMARPRS